MADRVRAAIYCRLSRKGGRSVERQEADGRRIAREKGWGVVAVYRETASASPFAKKAREQWDALLAAVEGGEFDAVILWMEDRSARDVIQAGVFVQACQKAGLSNLVLPSFDYDLTDQEDVSRFYCEVLAGQREAAKISKRVRRARLEEAEELHWPHPGGPRGFGDPGGRRVRDPSKGDDDPEKWLRDKRGRWLRAGSIPDEQVEAERKLIREAARRLLAGDSLRALVVDWNEREITGPTGRRWTTQTLRGMLLAPRLAGLRTHRGTLYPSMEIQPILELDTWQTLRALLTDPARRSTAVGGTPQHLLTGLAFCGVCGARLRVYRGRAGERRYQCPDPSRGGHRCVGRQADPVERLIEGALFKAVESPEWDAQAAERPADDPARPPP